MGKIFSFIRKHKIIAIIAAVIFLGGIVLFFNSRKGNDSFSSVTVKNGNVFSVIEASGKLKAGKSAQVMFRSAAKVAWVGVKKGDRVKKGQTLASLDRRELELAIKKKLSDYQTARWNFEQTLDDYDTGGRKLDELGTLTEEERRIIEKSQFTLNNSVSDVEIANLAFEQSYLYSPIDGVVVEDGHFTPGEMLTSTDITTRFMKVIDDESIYFQADVDEGEYAKIRVGMKTKLSLDAYPDSSMSGIVSYIGGEAVKKTGGGIQIPIDITILSKDIPLIPELTGDANMILDEKIDVLVVDKTYARKKNGSYVVDIQKDGKKQEKSIEVGLIGTKTLEVISGLQAGDTIVVPKSSSPPADSMHGDQMQI